MLLKSEDEVYRQSYQMLTEHKDLMDRSVWIYVKNVIIEKNE